jgi:hypothetical protein
MGARKLQKIIFLNQKPIYVDGNELSRFFFFQVNALGKQ